MSEAEQARWRCLAGLRDEAVRSVRMRISRPDEAEDHVHDAMVRLSRRDDLRLDDAGLRSLLVRAACALAIDGSRRRTRQQRLALRLGDPREMCGESPEDLAADRGEAAWLAMGLSELGRMEQAALLHSMEGLAPGEIAQQLGVGYKAAENALSRARRKLRLRAAAVASGVGVLVRRVFSRDHNWMLAAASVAGALVMLTGPGAVPAVEAAPPAHHHVAAASLPPIKTGAQSLAIAVPGPHPAVPRLAAADQRTPHAPPPPPTAAPPSTRLPVPVPSGPQPIVGIGGGRQVHLDQPLGGLVGAVLWCAHQVSAC